MKKSLFVLLIFFSVCILGSLAGSTLFMLYGNLTSLVANQSDTFFSFTLFIPGLIVSFPLVCILSLIFLIFLEIRHSSDSVFPFVTYILLGLLSWCVLIPLDLNASVSYIQNHNLIEASDDVLSSGVFRKTEDGIEFYSKVTPEGLADGILIDVDGKKGEAGQIIPFANRDIKLEKSDLFADSLIKTGARMSGFVSVPLEIYADLMVNGTNSWIKDGYIPWLCYAFMGFALMSIYGIKSVSSWKLLNAIFIVISACMIAVVNYIYFTGETFNRFALEWARMFADTPIDNAFIVFINMIFILIFSSIGIVKARKNKKAEEGDFEE